MRALRDELKAIYPAISFYVLISPGHERARRMGRPLKALDLAVLDTHDLYDREDSRMRVSASDYHPSAIANEVLARKLVAEVNSRHDSK